MKLWRFMFLQRTRGWSSTTSYCPFWRWHGKRQWSSWWRSSCVVVCDGWYMFIRAIFMLQSVLFFLFLCFFGCTATLSRDPSDLKLVFELHSELLFSCSPLDTVSPFSSPFLIPSQTLSACWFRHLITSYVQSLQWVSTEQPLPFWCQDHLQSLCEDAFLFRVHLILI